MRQELTKLRSDIATLYNGANGHDAGYAVSCGALVPFMRTLDEIIKSIPSPRVPLTNDKVCPETAVAVLLVAVLIPDGAKVSKRGGEVEFVLKHKLTIYPVTNEGSKPGAPMVVDGFFLVETRTGVVSQVKASQPLLWRTTAEGFVDTMRDSWRGPSQ